MIKINMIKIKCAICGKEIVNPNISQKTCSRECSRECSRAYKKAYQKTDKYKAYQKAYYLKKKQEKN